MSNYLKIYDFIIRHKTRSTNTDYYWLAQDQPELIQLGNLGQPVTDSIQRQVIFDAFLRKFNNDLNREILKNTTTKKIIKRSKNHVDLATRDIISDFSNKALYGLLNAGKITSNSILEKINEDNDENEYDVLNGARIYDDFFFLLHISFRCNIARLFILTRKDNTNVDAVLKKYLRDNLFKAPNYNKTQCVDFIPDEYRDQVLNRSIVSSISISKAEALMMENDDIEYDIEIRLKPRATNVFAAVSQQTVNFFKRTRVVLDEFDNEDTDGEVKFNIKDPDTNNRKTISFGSQDNFLPRLVLEDDEILGEDSLIDVERMKSICLEYIRYDNDQLI